MSQQRGTAMGYFLAVCLISTILQNAEAWVPQLSVFVHPASRSAGKPLRTVLQSTKSASKSGRKPSRVSDPDGPTPEIESDDTEDIDPESIDGVREIMSQDELPHPIPHQPWRRGSTDGCEAPIDAEWRQAAEQIIYTAVKLVGGKVLDVTWFLTQVIVTLDENLTVEQRDLFKASGPVIDVMEPSDPMYGDPNDPEPDEIIDPDAVMYQRQTEEEKDGEQNRLKNRWATKDEDDPADEPHNPMEYVEPKVPLYRNEEGRDDIALRALEEEQVRYMESEKRVDIASIAKVDTMALSTIAGAILEGLEEVEEELDILRRHELVLASPGAPDVLETQKQFNAYRGSHVVVETQDPFDSNRVLKGQLVDRNSMDVIINQKGRMVTIPLVFVKCVRIPMVKKEANAGAGEEEDEEPEEYNGPMP